MFVETQTLAEDLDLLKMVLDFYSFDKYFTTKVDGFRDVQDFYRSVSADNWMEHIQIPTLIIYALNDPLILDRFFPVKLAETHPHIFLEMPNRGGHTGFLVPDQEFSWAEYRFLEFLGKD